MRMNAKSPTLESLMERLRTRVTYSFEVEVDEHTAIEGNASAIDPVTDAETVTMIRAQLKRGNVWAWCVVRVTAQFREWRGVDVLGAVSYASEKDFREAGEMESMEAEALHRLARTMLKSFDELTAAFRALGFRGER